MLSFKYPSMETRPGFRHQKHFPITDPPLPTLIENFRIEDPYPIKAKIQPYLSFCDQNKN